MACKPSTFTHCGGLEFHPYQDEYVNSILYQKGVLIICQKCYNLIVAKPISAISSNEANQQQYSFTQ